MKKYLRYTFAVIGISIFAVLVHRMGPAKILDHLTEVGWWILPTLCLSIVWYILYTFAWYQFLKPLNGKIKLRELFRIKIIGEALNTLTPMNFVAGDPARAYFLRHRFSFTEGAASVVVDRTLHSISTLTIILIGTACAFVQLDFLPNNIKYGLPVVLAVAFTFVGFIFIHQHKGLFSLMADIAQRLRIKKSFSTETLDKFEEVDGHIQDFYQKNKKGFWIALSSHFFGRVLGLVEIYMIGHVVDSNFSFQTALLLGAVAPIINFTFAFIPGSLGVLESTYSAILYFLHFSPAIGLTIQIIRRVRAALWITTGFIFLGGRSKLSSLVTK